MSEMRVEYLDHMGTDLTVVNRARKSYDKVKTEFGPEDAKLIEYLASGLRTKERQALISEIVEIGVYASHNCCENDSPVDNMKARLNASLIIDRIQSIQKHWSPFSHCFVSFHISCPIAVARQLHRSGVGFAPPIADDFGISELSRRYVSDEPEFYQVKKWRVRDADTKQGSSGIHPDQNYANAFQEVTNEFAKLDYSDLIGQGFAPEQVRFNMPQSMMTNFDWTGSLYAWSNLCRQRLDPHTQEETREIALAISAEMARLFPVSWKALVRV